MTLSRSFCVLSVNAEGNNRSSAGVMLRDMRAMNCENRQTLQDSTVSAGARRHVGEDAIDLLQFFNSNIVKLVLTAQKRNISKSVDKN